MKRFLMILGALFALIQPAHAQLIYGQQVSGCGTPGNAPVTGNTYPVTQFNGQVCVNATVTPSGTQNVNLAQVGGTDTVTGGVAGSQGVGGLAASGALNAGNPMKVGCAFNTTLPTLTNGLVGDAQCNSFGQLDVFMIGGLNTAHTAQSLSGVTPFTAASNGGVAGFLFTTNWLYNGSSADQNVSIVGQQAAGTGTGVNAVEQAGASFSEITSATTTAVASGAHILHAVNVNTCVSGATVKVYNATTATGTPITITCGTTTNGLGTFTYNAAFNTGITVVTSGATDVTVSYR